jgi:hypothetical protein
MIVGAPYVDYSGNTDCGAAYLYFGKPGGWSATDLNAGNADVVIYGGTANAHFGWSVSDAGNVSGDSYDDIIIGEPDSTNGKAYIFYGMATASWSSSYTTGDADVTLTGETSGDKFGFSVSSAGDVDNANNDDIIVGAPYNGANDKGEAYVWFGDGSITSGSPDKTLAGESDDNLFGCSVSGAGDVNNDGYSDVIIGAYGYGSNQGRAYIFYGLDIKWGGYFYSESIAQSNPADAAAYTDYLTLSLNAASSTDYLIVATSDMGPDGVSPAAGDITSLRLRADDTTTYHEVIRQFDDTTDWYHFSAVKYVTLSAGSHNIDLEYMTDGDQASFRNSRIIAIEMTIPAAQYDETETQVDSTGTPPPETEGASITFTPSSSGNYLIIASANVYHDDNADSAWGRMRIDNTVYGEMLIEPDDVSERMNFGVIKNITLDASSHTINLTVQNDDAGTTTASMNHAHIAAIRLDTFSEYHYSETETQNDGSSAWETLVTNSYTPTSGDFIILGTAEWYSNDVTDIDGIRMRTASTTRQETRVENQDIDDRHMTFQMDKRALSGSQTDTMDHYITSTSGWSKFARLITLPIASNYTILDGESSSDYFGWSVSDAGNVNDATYDDVIVGAPGRANNRGGAYLFFGGNSMENYISASSADVRILGSGKDDKCGFSVSSAGDMDNDNYDDVVVGAPYNDGAGGSTSNCGAVYVFLGDSSMSSSMTVFWANYTETGENADDLFGWAVSKAGDVNSDNYGEIIVGAPKYDDGANTDSGKGYVYTIIPEFPTPVIPIIIVIIFLFIMIERRKLKFQLFKKP